MKTQKPLKEMCRRSLIMSLPAGLLIATLRNGAGAEKVTPETAEAAVKNVISDFVEDWNRHDSKALADLHTEDANLVNIFGQWSKGKDNIEATWRKVHASAFANSKMVMDVDQIKFPAPNVAVVNGTMELLDAPPEASGRCHYIRVLVKTEGKWLISEFQNTMIRAGDPAKK